MLVGHYAKLKGGQQVDNKIYSRGYSEEALKMLQTQLKKAPTGARALNLEFSNIEQCKHPLFDFYLSCFDTFNRHGLLPLPGAYADQPAKIIEIFQVLEALKLETDREQQEKQRREQEKANRRNRRR